MTAIRYYLNINAYTPHGLVYYLIYQPLREFKETILVNHDGYIESFTKGIGKKLGLLSQRGSYKNGEKHISCLNDEFVKISLAFHIMNSPEKYLDDMRRMKEGRRLNKEEYGMIENKEEAKEIGLLYKEKGAVLELKKVNNGKKAYRYNCKINNVVMNGSLLMFIILENVESPLDTEAEESESKIDLTEDEKIDGWIDFSKMKTQRTSRSTDRNFLQDDDEEEEDQKLNVFDSSARKMIPRKSKAADFSFNEFNPDRTGLEDLSQIKSSKKAESVINLKENKIRQPQWLTQNKVELSKAFIQALSKIKYPSFYKVFLVVLYSLFILLFVFKILLHLAVDSSFPSFRAGKDILQIIQTKTRALIQLDSFVLCLHSYSTGEIRISDYSPALTEEFFLDQAKYYLKEIENADTNMIDVIASLDNEDAHRFFDADVRMFQTNFDETEQVYTNVTIFQAVVQIIQSSLGAFWVFENQVTHSEATPYLEFVIRNTVNDVLVRNEETDLAFANILLEKKARVLQILADFSIVLLVICLLLVVTCIYICYLQYKREKHGLISLLKLSKNSLKRTAGHAKNFQDLIKRNANFLMALKQEPISYLSKKEFESHKLISKTSQTSMQSFDFKPLRMRYYQLVGKTTVIIFISIIIIVVNWFEIHRFFNSLESQALKLHFLDQVNSKVQLTANLFQQLVMLDSSKTLVKNQPLRSVILRETQILRHAIGQVAEIFNQETVPEELELVKTAMFENSCKYVKDNAYHFYACNQLANNQENSGLINLLSNYELLLKDFYLKFRNSDLAVPQVKVALQLDVLLSIIYPAFLAMHPIGIYIAGLYDRNLNNFGGMVININGGLTAGLLLVFCGSLGLLHFLVGVKLREKEDQYKDLIQLFPADVVMSNFMLKSYIMRVSQDNLDSIREFL